MQFTQRAPTDRVTRQVAITQVDVAGRHAMGTSDVGTYYIDTSYYVGSVQVTPSLGDQWVIQCVNGQWRLDHRIPFNDPNQAAVVPSQGQHIVGSGQGPVELQGTVINANAPLAVNAYAAAALPDPASVPAGTHVYDATAKKPVWSNGTAWTDATGTPI